MSLETPNPRREDATCRLDVRSSGSGLGIRFFPDYPPSHRNRLQFAICNLMMHDA